ncbi:MAG: prephenate dehydrogenase/arogenate dehydrogenase family protein [Dehalococcoidia bacterium]|nr:prephenate dehydrogenase/arogenate dehydrogenase family protein [Dehalococcoidia bacterium]MDW8119451.1 prephenate dehydrogenase/arogenate dehydrogenase family protein [Chloroflexota bacterium]
MERIAIIGLGLIGTSLGLALKQAKLPKVEIVGHDKDPHHASRAHKRGAVDKTHYNLHATIEGARMVIIATPVMAIRDVLETIAASVAPGTIITDTGSTKGQVLQWAQELLPDTVSFVGGHPLGGKEESGPDAATPDLFRGVPYCIIPGKGANPDAVKSVAGLAETIGATPFFIDAYEHDSYVAAVSHLPFLLSIALVGVTTRSPGWREMSKVASTGYRDITRLASGDPQMHRDICLTNRDGIVHWLDEFIKGLYELRNLVKDSATAPDALEKAFITAWQERAKWLAGVTPGQKEGPSLPTASDAMLSLFVGERLAKRMRELQERERGKDKTPYPGSRP